MDVAERDGEQPAAGPVNRLERRKLRTRSALIRAAQGFIADGRLAVPVLEITQAADVGMGSFYNHFESKEELFAAAVTDALDSIGALLDTFTADIPDPAEAFAANYRLSGRLFRLRPQEAALLLANSSTMILSDRGLSPRALRDITAAIEQGRFTLSDPELGLALAGGVFVGLGTLLSQRPDRDAEVTVDEATEHLLTTFGMSPEEARELCRKPLPDIAMLQDASVG
ncbi:TetR family transcriptional regulator [Mycolicibacter minnesotensis]|uniref:TetR family transcriptional regulator n=1 Tax=Mycolicibacter minnesotensis TaxID=1118379 RepID=A0A7I7R665_9MYCO|nr:TetR/AcrR family transcriptional regulator [Mycolicibacter minnesotensis]ORA99942.1 TetR family transcriptional regulator [Mycolicibacter minnesotensis]BBY33626.1 putative TetR-family transcriptional regulator [Mycolicibacter minnesotensis]